MYIPPQSSVFLDIDNWMPIPVPRRLWLIMQWMYETVILPYMGPDGPYIMKFHYQHVLEWVKGTQVSKEAQNKKNTADNNRVLEEILLLVERYAPTHSPGANLINTNSGPKFPYVCITPLVQFTTEDVTKVAMLPSMTAELELRDSDKENTDSPLDLIYPFNDMSVDNQLLIPNPIVSSTFLPSDVPQPGMTIPREEPPCKQNDLIQEVFGNTETDVGSSSAPLPLCSSPLRSPHLRRSSPYSVEDPGRLLLRVSHVSSINDQAAERSENIGSPLPYSADGLPFLTSPQWSSETLSVINASVNSFISQIEEEMVRSHERLNRIIPGYPHHHSPPDTSNPYRGTS